MHGDNGTQGVANLPIHTTELLEKLSGGLFILRVQRDTLSLEYVNDTLCAMLGYARVEILSNTNATLPLVHKEDVTLVRENIRLLVEGGQSRVVLVFRLRRNGGGWLWVKAFARSSRAAQCFYRIHVLCVDVDTEIRRMQRAVDSAQRCNHIFLGTNDIIFDWNCQTRQLRNTNLANSQYGLKALIEDFPQRAADDHTIHPDDVPVFLNMFARYERGATSSTEEFRIRRSDGEYSWFRATSSAMFDAEGRLNKVVGLLINIDRYKMAMLVLEERAQRDPLTGVLNRSSLETRINKLLASVPAVAGLLLFDLDNFKQVNDTRGHSAGDRVLAAIAAALNSCFTPDDVIGRVGGDEFIICMHADNEEAVTSQAQQALEKLRQAAEQCAPGCGVTCSLGVALYPRHGNNYADLFHAADMALYQAKRHGKNCFSGLSANVPTAAPKKSRISEPVLKKSVEEQLEHQLWLYGKAMSQSRTAVWEYNIRTHSIEQTEAAQKLHGFDLVIEDVPESMIRCGYVHPDSIETFRRLHERVQAGEAHVLGDVRVRTADRKDYCWERISMTTRYDASGKPVSALGIGNDVTQVKEAEIRCQQELQLRLSVSEDLVFHAKVDLTRDRVEVLRDGGGHVGMGDTGLRYADLLERSARAISNNSERKHYLTTLERQAVQTAFAAGTTCLSLECRYKGSEGRLLWVCITANLLIEPGSGDLCILLHVRDIDERKRAELALRQRTERDTATGAYKKETALRLVRQGVTRAATHKRSMALLLINVDGFSALIGSAGFVASEEVLRQLGLLLPLKFGAGAVIGRMEGDEFLVFISGMDRAKVRAAAEDVRQTMNMPYMFPQISLPVSISIGMAFTDKQELDFDTLYLQAGMALDSARMSGRNRCGEYCDNMPALDNTPEKIPAATLSVLPGGGFDHLLLRCAFSFAADNFLGALQQVLQDLGGYYQADAVYLFDQDIRTKQFTTHMWHDAKSLGIQVQGEVFLGEAFQDFRAHVEYTGSMAVQDVAELHKSAPEIALRLTQDGVHSFICLALRQDGLNLGAMVILNPGRRRMDTALAGAVSYFLKLELCRRHYRKQERFYAEHDALTGLKNRTSFQNCSDNLDEDNLISLGVAIVDINGLKKLNYAYGASYGDNVILLVAQQLQQEFDEEAVYRLAGDEFLVLCQNMTHEAFSCKMDAVCNAIQTHGEGVTTGYVWADTDIHLQAMITAADQRLIINKQQYYQTLVAVTKHHNPAILQQLLENIEAGRYEMFLQPKLCIDSGVIVGAEALVRRRRTDGTLVPPDKFIPAMEKDGSIFHIDLHIFTCVCRMLAEWKAAGIPLMVISLNFSRATLFTPTLLEKVRAVREQFAIPPQFIEIEITESFSELDRTTLVHTCNMLAQLGFRIALDDYGARYSNLSILAVLPLSTLKLDKSLIDNVSTDKIMRSIVQHTLETCRDLDVESVAEGIESEEQLAVLHELGCAVGQGYLIDRPLPRTEFEEKMLLPRNHVGKTEH